MRIAVVVPEYRQATGGQGGLRAVADFLVDVFSAQPDWTVSIVSPRMSRSAAESRRIAAPRSWSRRPRVTVRVVAGRRITDVGADLAEIEAMRYRPRRPLDDVLASFDCVVVLAGSPAFAGVVSRLQDPVLLVVATFAAVERRTLLETTRGPSRFLLRVNTALTARLDRRNLLLPDRVVVMNAWMLRECRRLGARDVVLNPPGIDTEFFCPAARTGDSGYVLMVGRLGDPRKDVSTLLRAYAHARKLGAVTHQLVLAGTGALAVRELDLIDALGLSKVVKVERNLPQADLLSLLQQADLFIMSSTEEGLGLALVEALACGVPAISTRTEGARRVLGDGLGGLLVDVGDHVALGRTIAGLLGDAERRATLGETGRRNAVKNFSVDAAGSGFVNAVLDLTDDRAVM